MLISDTVLLVGIIGVALCGARRLPPWSTGTDSFPARRIQQLVPKSVGLVLRPGIAVVYVVVSITARNEQPNCGSRATVGLTVAY
jgi:hypothetical protein